MSEVSLSDTSLAIVALSQTKELLVERRNEAYRDANNCSLLIEALDEKINMLIEHNHFCMCWRAA